MAKREEFWFLSSEGSVHVHAVRWLPEQEPYRAVVQITHGMIEFIDRYEEFAEYLTDFGYVVAGHDQLGHGDSVMGPEHRGYFAEERGSDCLVWDIHRLRQIMQKEYPQLPYFMLGHSMGSFLMRKYITKYGEGLSGVILLGTGYISDRVVRSGRALLKTMIARRGGSFRSPLVDRLVFSGDYRQYDMSGRNPERSWLTRDPERAKAYYEDPRSQFQFTLNGYEVLLETVSYANQKSYMKKIPSELPILLMSGSEDPLGSFGKGVRTVQQQLEEAGVRRVDFRICEGNRHEVLNEVDRRDHFEELRRWCEGNL